jgi:hypothetical protein
MPTSSTTRMDHLQDGKGRKPRSRARLLASGMFAGLAAAMAISAAAPASAHNQVFTTTFTPLNAGAPLNQVGLNPSATGRITYNHDNETLNVRVMGSGFEPGIPHVAHIHGNLVNPAISGSGALNSMTPTLAQDVDHDGFINCSRA